MTMITVKYFASLKQLAGKDEDQFDIEGEISVSKLGDLIGQSLPKVGDMLKEKKVMISVNYDVVPLDSIVKDGDEVALLPPFSGGV